jgi:hypothetical protein
MVDWPIAFSTVTNAINLVKQLGAIEKRIDQATLKMTVADLTSSIAELKLTLVNAKEEAAAKEAEIERLQSTYKRSKDDLIEHIGYFYRKRPPPNEGPAGNPFCPVCYQTKGLLFETTFTTEAGRPTECPSCRAKFTQVRTFIN